MEGVPADEDETHVAAALTANALTANAHWTDGRESESDRARDPRLELRGNIKEFERLVTVLCARIGGIATGLWPGSVQLDFSWDFRVSRSSRAPSCDSAFGSAFGTSLKIRKGPRGRV